MRSFTILLLSLSVSACAWVTLTPGGEQVRVLAVDQVGACEELGTTHVSLRDKVAGIKRNEEQVVKDLGILARNVAADMGGDTVVPVTPVKDGRRTYAIYKCVADGP